MGGNRIRVTYYDNQVKAYVNATYTYAVLDLWKEDPGVYEIVDAETGELLFRKGF